MRTLWDFDSVLRNCCRVPYFLLWVGVYLDIREMSAMDNHHGHSIHLHDIQPFSAALVRNFFSSDFSSQTSLPSCFRNRRKKLLLLLSVLSFWRNTPEFEEAQLVHGISLIWGGNAFLQHPTSLWSHFLHYALEIVCSTVPISLLCEDIHHVEQYPQLEICGQILLLLLCSWTGDSIVVLESPVVENNGMG